MAARREESLSDLLPALNATLGELTASKLAARREAKAEAKRRKLEERRRKVRAAPAPPPAHPRASLTATVRRSRSAPILDAFRTFADEGGKESRPCPPLHAAVEPPGCATRRGRAARRTT